MRRECKPSYYISFFVTDHSTISSQPCSLTRRLAALVYDGLILVAIWIIGSGLAVLLAHGAIEPGSLWFQAYLLILSWAYFASGWMLGGQTVGMRAWQIHLISERKKFSWLDSIIRVLVGLVSLAFFGLGFIWSVFRKDCAGWHDLASRSRLVVFENNTGSTAA